MSRVLNAAFERYFEEEGGLVDNPSDPGGLTKLGIALNRNPDLTRQDILNMTPLRAQGILQPKYWDRCRCSEMPEKVALAVFDSAVNQGPMQAVKLAQIAAGMPSAQCDGLIGPATLAALKKVDVVKWLEEFAVQRILHYASLPTFKVFGKGWTRRTIRTLQYAENWK